MSRWHQQLENHPFKSSWNNIVKTSDEVVADDASVTTNVEEVSRFRKVVTYINDLIDNCDPELVPASTWQNFQQQSQNCWGQISNYQSNRNISHLQNANNHLDNLITYIAPHVRSGSDAASAATKAFEEYQKTVMQHMEGVCKKSEDLLTELETDAQSSLSEIIEHRDNTSDILVHARTLDESLIALKEKYFDGTENEDAISEQVDEFFEQIKSAHSKALDYQGELIDNEDSIQEQILLAKKSAVDNSDEIESHLSDVEARISDLKSFYRDVYGYEEEDKKVDGLKAELDKQKKDLTAFELEHKNKHEAFVEEIESLVSGATSAGLAKAYHDLKHSFDGKIKFYSRLFYGAMAGIFAVSLFSLTSELGWLYIKMVDTSSFAVLLPNVVNKLPFLLPIFWLAVFASKRRSEADRLQQEYAHKEAIATSYESFKKQIKELGSDDPTMMEKLLSSAINAISDNASSTLDGRHGDKSPLHELVEKVVPDLEKLNKVLPKSDGAK